MNDHQSLPVGTAKVIVELLETLRELPSTPPPTAEGAARFVELLEEQLPDPHHSQPWNRDRQHGPAVKIDEPTATAMAELLDVFAAMPSTPPAVAADARHQAELLWQALGG